MQVSDAMSRNVSIASPNDTLQSVAQIMAEKDLGFLPVGENDRLIGTITDRDIVVRALAKGQAASAQVRGTLGPSSTSCPGSRMRIAGGRSTAGRVFRRRSTWKASP